jgi:hypothetical protein
MRERERESVSVFIARYRQYKRLHRKNGSKISSHKTKSLQSNRSYSINPARRPMAARAVAARLSTLTPRAPFPLPGAAAPLFCGEAPPVLAVVPELAVWVTKPDVAGGAAPPAGEEAPGVDAGGAPEEAGAVELPPPLALAVARNVSKVLSAVGLIANTIPAAQWFAGVFWAQ